VARGYSLTFGGWREGDDPLLIAEDIKIAERNVGRFLLPLEEARVTIARDVKQRFDTETAPSGAKWAPWSEKYKARGVRENISILRKQKEYHRDEEQPQLYDAATAEDSFIINSHSVSAGSYGGGDIVLIGEALPDYWIYHQEGLGQKARPFFGVSPEAEATIYTIFDDYVDGALTGMIRRGPGRGQPMGRGGRFRSHFLSP
jgi:hypothetical protein